MDITGNRKLIGVIGLTVLIIGLASLFLWLGKLDGPQWVTVSEWAGGLGVGVFGIGNGIEHVTAIFKPGDTAPPAPPVPGSATP